MKLRPAPRIVLNEAQRSQLERWSRGGSTPYRLVIRSQIILLASRGRTNREIARLLQTNPITVARWRSRFALFGLEGIRTEAPRNGSPPPVPPEVVRKIIEKTVHEHPSNRSRWTTRSLAREFGVSHSTVRRIWKSAGIRPNRSRVAMLAQESQFRPKKIDLVGVYVNPPQRAVAISLRDGSSSNGGGSLGAASNGAAAGSSSRRAWMMDLVTTLNTLDRGEPLRTSRRHVEQEFLTFLRSVQERRLGNEKIVLLAEASKPSLSPQLARWLSRHPHVSTRLRMGSEPWNQSLLEMIKEVPTSRPTESPPPSLPQLMSAVARWKRENDDRARPFAWTSE